MIQTSSYGAMFPLRRNTHMFHLLFAAEFSNNYMVSLIRVYELHNGCSLHIMFGPVLIQTYVSGPVNASSVKR